MDPFEIDPPEGYRYVFVASYWRWGQMRRLYAAAYGLRAFRLLVRVGGPRRIPPDRAAVGQRMRPKATAPKRPVKRKPRRGAAP